MKRPYLLVALAAALFTLAFAASSASAQQQPMASLGGMPAASPGGVALIDVSYIYKNHQRFKQMMSQMETDIQAAEEAVKKEREAIKALGERLEEHRAGTPDYKALEEELAKRSSEMQIRVQLQKKDFMQRQAKIHYAVYREITDEVGRYAAANAITMVMKFNGDEVNLEKPDDVLRQISQQIVWFPKDRDITPIILEQLNRSGMNPGAQPGAAAAPASRQSVPLPGGYQR